MSFGQLTSQLIRADQLRVPPRPPAPPLMGEGKEGLAARALAQRVIRHWHDQGCAEVTAEPFMMTLRDAGRRPAWGIRSNLVAGMPPSMGGSWRPRRLTLRPAVEGQ